MPIYEYEPTEHECLICNGKVGILQNITDEPCPYCPTCGLPIKRIISRTNFKLDKSVSFDKAATRGFTTYRKADKGKWEKIAGEGDPILDRDKIEDENL